MIVFFSKQKVCSIQHSEKDCSEVSRSSSYVYRGKYRRQRVSKRNMTVSFFDKLTGQFSTLLSKLLSTCPEELSDSFFKIFRLHFFRSGNKWFQISGKQLPAVLSKLHSSPQCDCLEVFLKKEA